MRQLRKFINVALDATDKPFELREHFVHVRRNFRHRSRQDVEIVVAVHLQFAELRPERRLSGGRTRQHLRRLRWFPWPLAVAAVADAVEFVLLLKLSDFALEPFLRET